MNLKKIKSGIKLVVILIITTSVLSCQSKNENKPNVIIVLSDDQGWGDLSINGNKNLSTPNIDKLSMSGATFENFYVQPVCSPTRAELLTGRYHARGGVYSTSAGGERLDLDEATIAEVFKKAGYATAAYGKWHNGMQPPYHPNSRGFDDFYGFCSGHWGNYFNPMLEHNGEVVRGDGFLVDDLTNHGIEFIEKHKNEPFLLYLPLNTLHSPMQVPAKWFSKFENIEVGQKAETNEEDITFTKASLAMCENIDWNVGRLLNKLDELDLNDNTIILYFSDNGPNGWRWNGGMKGKKGSTDEGGVRSPLFVRWSGKIENGKQINEISSAIDILPTLTELTGISSDISKPMDGVSLKPLLLNDNYNWPDRFIFNKWRESISVRNQKYRLDSRDNLFDIENDRGQKNNLSSELSTVRKNMLDAKKKFVDEVLSELPKEDNREFTLGSPEAIFTQLPARDGVGHGEITRSNKYPNCTFFTNWIYLEDMITWDVNVLEEGNFDVTLYYTCPKGDEGSKFELSFGATKIRSQITEAFESELTGMENDRVVRQESYIKEFKPLKLGVMSLEKGRGQLMLKGITKPGKTVMDVRLLLFERK
ncbi:MAG: arylsulfatase [Melioribacteraceae bacterium]|nr:arylsulfatase [Melioribacteraceae bacterium]